ncbi:MAG TPA: immunoglobulin domain-containing protein, partial [Candidatus Binatia bacterium]|nr:immunoglobulin domain-containing protein [Candidatus Binatia bacterium]
ATATDAGQNTSEFSGAVRVLSPPVITGQPVGTNVALGQMVLFCVTAEGSSPLTYQWRLNGANIPGATNPCLPIAGVQLSDGGTYTVVVANDLDAITSDPALLLLDLPPVPAGDNFVDRITLSGISGMVSGSNSSATAEAGEPNLAGKRGGHSVWYVWTAPADGVATFRTTGSTFDTLLGVYNGTAVTNLTPVASDDDRGGFFASGVSFNTVLGTEYEIAIDGFGGAMGNFVFSWEVVHTGQFLPVITNQPISQTVAPGVSVTFAVEAGTVCFDGHHQCNHPENNPPDNDLDDQFPLFYQWLFNGQPIPGATNTTLTVSNVQADNVGNYTVQVSQDTAVVQSQPASLQINLTGPSVQPVQARDKFLDAADAPEVLRLGTSSNSLAAAEARAGQRQFTAAAIVRGYTGTQVFSTVGSTTEGEVICGVIGGASQWISLVCEEPGFLFLNTEGSSFNTVLAVYRRSATNAAKLELMACDHNSGLNGRSALSAPVEARRTNFIVIDGVNGASGILKLNYSLVAPSTLTTLSLTGQNAYRLTGYPTMRFTIETSSNLMNWEALLTTNSDTGVFDFTDPSTLNAGQRFYRALTRP